MTNAQLLYYLINELLLVLNLMQCKNSSTLRKTRQNNLPFFEEKYKYKEGTIFEEGISICKIYNNLLIKVVYEIDNGRPNERLNGILNINITILICCSECLAGSIPCMTAVLLSSLDISFKLPRNKKWSLTIRTKQTGRSRDINILYLHIQQIIYTNIKYHKKYGSSSENKNSLGHSQG